MGLFKWLAFIMLFFIFFINNADLTANEIKRIAVFNIEAKNTPKAYADIARDSLEINLHKSGAFIVLERSQINLILQEQGLQMSGCTDTSCIVQIGKVLSADLVVIGSLSRITAYTVSVKMVDIGKGSIILADMEKIATEDDIENAIERIAIRLAKNFTGQKEELNAEKDKEKTTKIIKQYNIVTKKEQLKSKGPYGILSLGFIGISAALAGSGYYYDMKLKDTISDYNNLADIYKSSTDSDELESLHNDMVDKKKEAANYEKTRNILYGAGIGTAFISIFFIYKYFTAKPSDIANPELTYMPIIPIIYTSYLTDYSKNKHENFFGVSVFIKF